jgi:starch phosphorylase
MSLYLFYSGGLGVLAGGPCKSASDLGLPLVLLDYFIMKDTFIQRLTAEVGKESRYEKHEFSDMAVSSQPP